jgi:uncharacterized delta-60 repeat protein
MAAQTKVSGIWRNMSAPYVKVGGTWKIAKSAWAKVDNSWMSWFLQGGVMDTAFTAQVGTGPIVQDIFFGNYSGSILSIAIQPDGKIILGGDFTTWNGIAANNIVRLNSNGTVDTAFVTNTGTGTGANGTVNAIAIQSDGKIVIGGSFNSFNGVTANRRARLNSNGTLDNTFLINTSIDSSIRAIEIQLDGKIVLIGNFSSIGGVTANRTARLNSDGTLDTAFVTNVGVGASSSVNSLAIQSDGKIIIGGIFTFFNQVAINRIVRLNSDGTRDTTFTTNTGTGANNSVNALAVQPNGQILVGGIFTTFNGVTINRIVRLNSDGTRDTAFTTNTGTGAASTITSIENQSDNKIVLIGGFDSFNDVTTKKIVRIGGDIAE